ncbi:MAG: helix-turn-helix domain-containing protein [Pseudonocardiaceae bacterium]
MRSARLAQGLTQAQLGNRAGYSAAQVSRYERGSSPLTDVTVLRCFADALRIPPQRLGLAPVPPRPERRHENAISTGNAYPRLPPPRVATGLRPEEGEDPVRRRQLITSLVVTAATNAGFPLLNGSAAPAGDTAVGELLIARVSDAMLGLRTTTPLPPDRLRVHLASALADFHACRYRNLASHLPQLICAGHALTADDGDPDHHALLAQVYLLTTRMLIKLDDQQLGWMAADRARVTADAAGHPLIAAEAARNLAVLARKAGRHAQALSIALTAADHPDLRGGGPSHTAQRGLLIQSAAYTLARTGDQQGMRHLTDHAAAIATELGGATLLRDHGGGFNPTTVQLHRISAENSAGDPSAAIAAARKIVPQTLPTLERRARYYTDLATAFGHWGKREDCTRALLSAEHHAPEETHTRPAVRALLSGLLISGRTNPELRALAARCGIQ